MNSSKNYSLVAIALVLGSTATLVPRLLDNSSCQQCGGPQQLHAPFYAAFLVFVASSLGLVIEAAQQWKGDATAGAGAIAKSGHNGRLSSDNTKVLIIVGTINVAGTASQLIALLYIPAAVLAGMRGVMILLTAVFSRVLRLRDAPRTRKEWSSVVIAASGAAAVGIAAALQAQHYPETVTSDATAGSTASSSMLIGIALCALGYTFASIQVATEAVLLDRYQLTRWTVLGVEGVWGVFMVAIIMAILQYGAGDGNPLEVPSHTLCCLQNNPSLSGYSVAYGLSSLSFNALLLVLSSRMGANTRAFVFTARGALTWAIELVLFYAAGASYGTGASPYSVLELLGFVLLIGGGVYRVHLQSLAAAAGEDGSDGDVGVDEGLSVAVDDGDRPLLAADAENEPHR